MKKSLRDALLRELDAVCLKLLESTGEKVPPAYVKEVQRVFRESPGYVKIKKGASKADDADFEAAKKAIATKFLPAMRKPLLQIIKTLPHETGGQPPKLKEEQKREACALILDLIGKGRTEKVAITDAAAKYEVSYRTMQRAWNQRAKLLASGETNTIPPPGDQRSES